ncbi:MAG: AAA family ATPase [Bacteroidia bacterium]|nr:AAA family ATPase [Bacteroidia bacterium]
MKKVILMRGLPGSGKSTYAKKLVSENPNSYKRINRDDMRMMFDNGVTSDGNEKFVKKVRDLLIVKALEEGKHVIVDDTNLSDKNEKRIRQLVLEFNKANNDEVQVEIKEMEATLEECLERDSKREKPVGQKVIKTMHRQFYHKDPEYKNQDESLPKAIICDLDGTLALLNGRSPYDASQCDRDILNKPVAGTLKNYASLGFKIILVSGRQDTARELTENWLKENGIVYEMLLMRKAKDQRKDSIIKKEIFDTFIADKYFIEFTLDDRDQVVDMWRNELGLACYQVYYGNF